MSRPKVALSLPQPTDTRLEYYTFDLDETLGGDRNTRMGEGREGRGRLRREEGTAAPKKCRTIF